MPEPNDPKTIDPEVEPINPQKGSGEPQDPKHDGPDIDKEKSGILNDLKSERKKRQDLEKELESIRESKKAEEAEKLKEENKWKELYEKAKAEWENKFKELEPKAKSYDEIKAAELVELKKLLGEDWTDDMENIPIPTLKKLVDKKYPDKTPDTDGSSGKVAIKKRVEQLSESERKEANRMNLTLEDYVELKLKNEKKKE